MWRRLLGPLAVLLLLSTAIALGHYLGRGHVFNRENIEALETYIAQSGIWGPLVYMAICIVAIALMSPATPWIVVAAMFGVVRGIVLASLGITLGAGVCFLMARHAMRPILYRLVGQTREFHKIDAGVKAHGWRMVMLTRLLPIFPFNIQNFAYGLTSISFWIYLAVTWICTLPAVVAYVLAAGALVSGRGDPRRVLAYLAVAALLLAALSLIPHWLKKRTAALSTDWDDTANGNDQPS